MKNKNTAINEIFYSIFDAPLKEHGFRRKDVLYYRLNGNILQGIVLVRLQSDYMIRYNMFPYWVYGSDTFHREKTFAREVKALQTGAWAEGQIQSFNGVPYTLPLQPEIIKRIEGNMANTLCEIMNGVIRKFDEVRDEFTYFAYLSYEPWKWYTIEQKIVLRIASLQNDFGLAKIFLKRQQNLAASTCYGNAIQNYVHHFLAARDLVIDPSTFPPNERYRREDPKQFLFSTCNGDIAGEYAKISRQRFALLEEKIRTNDLHWIDAIYKEDCIRVAKLLKEALNLDII